MISREWDRGGTGSGTGYGTGASVITICNYDKFQDLNQLNGTGAGQARSESGTVEQKTNNTRRGEETPSQKTPPYIPPKKGSPTVGFSLPDWVPQEAWDGWLDMRRKSKHPATVRAQALAVGELEKLKRQGHDPGKLLDLATLHGWRGIFPGRNGETLAKSRQEALNL